MNLITVIPLARAKVAPTLSYFTAAEAPVGAVVSVPLRSKSIYAIIIESRPVADLKAEIRSAPYEIRKLGKIKANAFFPASFMDACRTLADYYATNLGAIVNAAVASIVIESANKIPPPLPMQASFLSGVPAPDETYAVQGDDGDRLSAWKSLIRQEFARKRSIAFYAPTVEDAARLHSSLEKGIEGYIFFLHAGLAAKDIVGIWKRIADTGHPVVVVATGSFPLLPRDDIETVVIERENARGWVSQRAPYADGRRILEAVSRRARRTVYIADCLLSTETLHRVEQKEIAPGTPFKWRSISTADDDLVDMKEGVKGRNGEQENHLSTDSDQLIGKSTIDSNDSNGRSEPNGNNSGSHENADDLKKNVARPNGVGTDPHEKNDDDKPGFRVLSTELERLIERTRDESSHLFILTSRRGTAPITVCNDCETLVACRQCSAPVVLHTGPKSFFMCHSCGERRPADETCAHCGGWRLAPLGIGIDRVREEVARLFPGVALFKIDADTTKTEAQIGEALARFKGKPGSVLLGTEMALPYLSEPIDHIAVASLDSLFALPDYRIEERVMYALIRLRGLASRSILVQTRRAEERVWGFGLKGNLSDFHRAALNGRKRFGYPPFSTLIKITLEGKKEMIARHMGEIQSLLAPVEVDVFPAFTATVRGNSLIHGLVKVEPHQWPDAELADKLRRLPPSVSVKVDPESLL